MSDATPTAEMLATWAAEQQWDWSVRMLCAGVCIVIALIALIIYFKWGRSAEEEPGLRARRYLGRLTVVSFVLTVAEASFFRDSVSTLVLLITTLVIGIIGLRTPREES